DYTVAQREHLLERIVHAAGGGRCIIAAVSSNIASDVGELASHAASMGVRGIAFTPPYYNAWTSEELKGWTQAALVNVSPDIEIYAYHIPSAVHNGWDVALVSWMRERFGIRGIKDSSGDVGQLTAYLALAQEGDFSVLAGNERLLVYNLMMGGTGVVSGLSSAYPDLVVQAYRACVDKNWDDAARLQAEINARLAELGGLSPRAISDVLIELAHATAAW
ncbi:MAG TPA: dihydrodipicolinate synthase family protein, partial [Ktedonobacterales bacterium]|nr:dihydrodipicolinate synthase family protein [Ktedonobacterales bacterium]